MLYSDHYTLSVSSTLRITKPRKPSLLYEEDSGSENWCISGSMEWQTVQSILSHTLKLLPLFPYSINAPAKPDMLTENS